MTSFNGAPIDYDAIGNPTSIDLDSLTWQGRELQSYTDDYYRTTYTYNADGIRTSKEEYEFFVDYVERTEYMLNGSQIIGETVYFSQDAGVTFTEQYTLIYLYDESSTPIGMMYRTPSYSDYAFDYYLFEKNLQGDIIAIYNASGTKIGSYTYDAWGNCTATSNISGYSTILYANPFRYRGYYYDTETGFYYLQSRYYNPTWGRFLNADGNINANGDILGYNIFAYCSNNPVKWFDPCGTCFHRLDFWNSCERCEGKSVSEIFEILWEDIVEFANDVVDAVEIDIGVGVGIGISQELSGFDISALVRADIITLRKDAGGDIYLAQADECYVNVSGAGASFSSGYKALNFFSGDRIEEQLHPDWDLTASIGTSGYLLFGITVKIGFDLEHFIDSITSN